MGTCKKSSAALILSLLLAATMLYAGATSGPAASQPAAAQADLRPNYPTLLDTSGVAHALPADGCRATAVIFLGTECPISRRAIAPLNEIAASHHGDGVALLGVISDPSVSWADARKFQSDYHLAFPLLMDVSGELAAALKPGHTPEAYVLDTSGAVRYRGRIDDSFAAIGVARQVVRSHDLEDALNAVAAGRAPAEAETESVGCVFEAWRSRPTTAPAVTYSHDVAPILYANCVSCHRPGEVAPFSLLQYSDAAKRAEQIATVVEQHYMPPWKPVAGYGHFAGERRLTADQIATIRQWADADAPEGDAAALPPMPQFASDWALGKPDLVVKMPVPFKVPASGRDVYRCFVAPINLPTDSFIAGFEFRAGAKSVLHHCILYLDSSGAARKLEKAAAPGPGYPGFGGPGFTPSGSLGGWAPGATPYLLPDGIGKPIAAGSDLVFQMHYHPDGTEHEDQSEVAIYLQKTPIHSIVGSIPLITRQIDIPAGVAHYQRIITAQLPSDMTILGVTPHMHLIGREMSLTAALPSGKLVPMIRIDDWEFQWQDQYRYAEPLLLPKGTVLTLIANYDNSVNNPNNPSNPPNRVRFGEQTTDEMCICFVNFLAKDQQELRTVRREVLRDMAKNTFLQRFSN